MLKKLIKVANSLDGKGFAKEADVLDKIILAMAEDDAYTSLPQWDDLSEKYKEDMFSQRELETMDEEVPLEELLSFNEFKKDLRLIFRDLYKAWGSFAEKAMGYNSEKYSWAEGTYWLSKTFRPDEQSWRIMGLVGWYYHKFVEALNGFARGVNGQKAMEYALDNRAWNDAFKVIPEDEEFDEIKEIYKKLLDKMIEVTEESLEIEIARNSAKRKFREMTEEDPSLTTPQDLFEKQMPLIGAPGRDFEDTYVDDEELMELAGTPPHWSATSEDNYKLKEYKRNNK